jgi:hypothetical protein
MAKHHMLAPSKELHSNGSSDNRLRLASVIVGGALLLSSAGCSWLPFRVEGERPLLGTKGPQRKTVVDKEPPGTLIAVDGTICIVPANKFESTEVDDRVWCEWRPRWEWTPAGGPPIQPSVRAIFGLTGSGSYPLPP